MNRMFPKVDNETRKLVRQINRNENHGYRRACRIGSQISGKVAHSLRKAVR